MTLLIPPDTDRPAFEAQLEFYRRIGPEARVRLAFQMSEEAREISKAGIKLRHPDYSELQVTHALFRLLLGDELYSAAYPAHEPVVP